MVFQPNKLHQFFTTEIFKQNVNVKCINLIKFTTTDYTNLDEFQSFIKNVPSQRLYCKKIIINLIDFPHLLNATVLLIMLK